MCSQWEWGGLRQQAERVDPGSAGQAGTGPASRRASDSAFGQSPTSRLAQVPSSPPPWSAPPWPHWVTPAGCGPASQWMCQKACFWVGAQMDGWARGWVDRRMDGWVGGRAGGWVQSLCAKFYGFDIMRSHVPTITASHEFHCPKSTPHSSPPQKPRNCRSLTIIVVWT